MARHAASHLGFRCRDGRHRRGSGAELDPPFPAHFHLLGHDKYGLTSLQNLDQLPATGAVIVVAPLPIVGGTGSPTRVFALVESETA